VDITASSVAEILADLFQKYEQELIDEDIATCLLAGIIEKTGSFQHAQTTPKAFIKASELVNFGGRQQEIIKYIYKTKSLPLLKLWGRALARMKIMEDVKAIISVLAISDFERAEAGAGEILPALKEFIDHVGGYKVIALITEAVKGQTRLLGALHEQVPTDQLMQQLGDKAAMLNYSLGNYKLIEINAEGESIENLQSSFLDALKVLPKTNN
jgi:nanoRNase/pAp phosphatase (c-di-AMP/oligoRNAs hydrolase)